MDSNIKPGEIVIPHDFCDFTKNRTSTFFDEKRIHVDMTKPFCSSLRELLIYSCEEIEDICYHKKGIYITTEGPRLETQTEINFYSNIGNIIGMTLSPEIILSKEKGICFASVCLVCNMAAGLQARLTAKEISYIYKKKEPLISKILEITFSKINVKKDCNCKEDISEAAL
jgi:5'-methylthioadenosine phosphorylase